MLLCKVFSEAVTEFTDGAGLGLMVTGQNGSGQIGMDKMAYGQNGIGQIGMDKMARTKWYGQNGSNFWIRI